MALKQETLWTSLEVPSCSVPQACCFLCFSSATQVAPSTAADVLSAALRRREERREELSVSLKEKRWAP